MFKFAMLICAGLVLAGCQTTQARHHSQCASMGYRPGTALYLQCREFLSIDRARRSDQFIAVGTALMESSRPPRSIICSRWGQNIVCQ
jgi:hypothetical protein